MLDKTIPTNVIITYIFLMATKMIAWMVIFWQMKCAIQTNIDWFAIIDTLCKVAFFLFLWLHENRKLQINMHFGLTSFCYPFCIVLYMPKALNYSCFTHFHNEDAWYSWVPNKRINVSAISIMRMPGMFWPGSSYKNIYVLGSCF